jgi:hypothetical protein
MAIQIRKGQILTYRIFDVAEEINLSTVEQILTTAPSRLALTRSKRVSIVIRNPPIRVNLGKSEFNLNGQTVSAETTATIWDYGAISIIHSIPVPEGATPEWLLEISSILNDEAKPYEELERISRTHCETLTNALRPALQKPNHWDKYEDYVIYFLEKVDGLATARDLLTAMDVPGILLGETEETLSEPTRKNVLENVYQYSADDLVVVDWNSAVILDPTGQNDFPDVIEFALTHLLELRYFDDVLDARLSELYDAVEQNPPRIWGRSYSKISHAANTRYMEISEFLERVDNSLKVVGDFFLARLFRAATRRFRLSDWQSSVTRKMKVLVQVSEILQGEVDVVRSHWMEAVVILLIGFEILSAILKKI